MWLSIPHTLPRNLKGRGSVLAQEGTLGALPSSEANMLESRETLGWKKPVLNPRGRQVSRASGTESP